MFLGAASLLLLAGCGSGSYSSSRSDTNADGTTGTPATTSAPTSPAFDSGSGAVGTKDAVVATPSIGGTLAVEAGASQTVSITFTSNDGRLITGFGVSDTLGTLPTGWSGPTTFACAALSTGSGCVLNLTYSPTAAAAGTVTVNYIFVDDSTQPKTGGSVTIPYVATPSNNLVAAASPTGQIAAVVGGGTQSVSINFSTDDGNAATDFAITSDLTALPTGWHSATSPTCAIVSTGSGCQVLLSYAPTAAGSGSLSIAYSFTDDAGVAKVGALAIPYAATTANNLIATASPTGQVIAVQNTAGQAVTVAFTTDNGKPATQLFVTSNLAALPAGWSSSTAGLACGSVSSGNGCQLHLTYAPTALTLGTLTLNYVYTDSAGTSRNGLLNVGYAGATNDVVVGTESPSSQIDAIISDGSQPGNGSQAVTITFATGDGRPATALQITSDLTTLPAGWTSTQTTFGCVAVDSDNVCRLPLAYAPTAAGSGSLLLNYAYQNNAGEAKTGTVNVAYRATVNDNVGWQLSPSSLPPVRTGDSTAVSVAFTTDDGNPATAFAVTGLGSLPAGWTSASTSFTCTRVTQDASCTLALQFAPTTAITNGTLTLSYSYVNDAGFPGTGTVTVAYSAYTPYLYVVDSGATTVSACALNFDDSVGACSTTGAGFNGATGIALSGSYAYVTNTGGNSVSRCALAADGALATCIPTGPAFAAPTNITFDAVTQVLYVYQSSGLTVCTVAAGDGTLTGCAAASAAFEPLYGLALSANGGVAYGVHTITSGSPATTTSVIDVCSATSAPLTGCSAAPASTPQALATLAVQNGALYVQTSTSLYLCPINAGGSTTSCQTTATGTNPAGLAFSGSTAYLSNHAGILACAVDGMGFIASCTTDTDATFNGTAGVAVRYH